VQENKESGVWCNQRIALSQQQCCKVRNLNCTDEHSYTGAHLYTRTCTKITFTTDAVMIFGSQVGAAFEHQLTHFTYCSCTSSNRLRGKWKSKLHGTNAPFVLRMQELAELLIFAPAFVFPVATYSLRAVRRRTAGWCRCWK